MRARRCVERFPSFFNVRFRVEICSNKVKDVKAVVTEGAAVGTLFLAVPRPLRGRKRWILLLPRMGDVVVTAAAARGLERDKSLFATGVARVTGTFAVEEAVRLLVEDVPGACADNGDAVCVWKCNTHVRAGAEPRELGRAIVNYSADEVRRLAGKASDDFFEAVGYSGAESIAHRNNICLWVPYGEEPIKFDSSNGGSATTRSGGDGDPQGSGVIGDARRDDTRDDSSCVSSPPDSFESPYLRRRAMDEEDDV